MLNKVLLWFVSSLLVVSAGCSASSRADRSEPVAVTQSALSGDGVTWNATAGISASGSSLTKTGADSWSTEAQSTQQLTGNGSVQFTVGETTTYKMVGLTAYVGLNWGYKNIDFAFFLTADAVAEIYEDGTLVANVGSYTASDVFGLQVNNNDVTYLKNGTVLHTSTLLPRSGFPLVLQASLYSHGATLDASMTDSSYWQSPVGVSVSGHSLTKTAADGWNAGAFTVGSFPGDGTATFTTAEANTYKMAGMTHAVTDDGYATIDFALFLTAQGTVDVYEQGNFVTTVGSYAPNDVLGLQVSGGVVTYLKNGAVLYTSTRTPTFPLFLDASLYSDGATIGGVTLSPAPFWQNIVGVSVSGTSITKTPPAYPWLSVNGWNAGASTIASLSGDGYARFTAGNIDDRAAGLTHTVADSGFATIDFAFVQDNGSLAIYEDGQVAAGSWSWSETDELRIQVTNGVVTYLQNGKLLYTSTKTPTFPLVFDASLYYPNTTLTGVFIGPTPFWQNAISVSISNHSITKTGGDGWNAGASTISSLPGDGSATFTTAETNTYKMAGLTHAVTDSSYDTIDYALFLTAQGTVSIYEGGTFVAGAGSYAANDVFSVKSTGGVVTYLQNGNVLYTSTKAPTFPLFVDASLYSNGATIQNVTLSP
jgi:hypothetical protein